MANPYTSTDLLASLKRRGMIPTSSSTFTAADFYKILDDELQTYIVPLLLEVREEYLVSYTDISVTPDTLEYFIPERAIAGKVRDVSLSDGAGNYHPLTRLEPDYPYSRTSSGLSGPGGFYLRGNKIVFPSGTTATLRITFYQRPNRIVAVSDTAEVVSVSVNDVNLADDPPSAWTTTDTFDFVKGTPGFDILNTDFTASVVGSTMTFTSTPPTDLVAGDFICLAGESPVPQIPVELHPLLAQRATATVLHALGDPKAENAYSVASKMEERALKLLTPRTEGANRYVVNRRGVGFGRRNRGWW